MGKPWKFPGPWFEIDLGAELGLEHPSSSPVGWPSLPFFHLFFFGGGGGGLRSSNASSRSFFASPTRTRLAQAPPGTRGSGLRVGLGGGAPRRGHGAGDAAGRLRGLGALGGRGHRHPGDASRCHGARRRGGGGGKGGSLPRFVFGGRDRGVISRWNFGVVFLGIQKRKEPAWKNSAPHGRGGFRLRFRFNFALRLSQFVILGLNQGRFLLYMGRRFVAWICGLGT